MGTTSEKLAYLQETKEAIKDAIVNKGVEVTEDTTFREYANKIGEISGEKTAELSIKFAPLEQVGGFLTYINQDGNPVVITQNTSNSKMVVPIPQLITIYTEKSTEIEIIGECEFLKDINIRPEIYDYLRVYIITGDSVIDTL